MDQWRSCVLFKSWIIEGHADLACLQEVFDILDAATDAELVNQMKHSSSQCLRHGADVWTQHKQALVQPYLEMPRKKLV